MLKIFLFAFIAVSNGIRLKTQEKDDPAQPPPQPPSFNIKQFMINSGPQFTPQEFEQILTRKDGLTHILYIDVENITNSLQKDFNEIIKVRSIGKSWEGKDINVITLDATQVLNPAPIQTPQPTQNQAKNKSAAQTENNLESPLIVEPKTLSGDSLLLAQINNKTDSNQQTNQSSNNQDGEYIAVPAKPPPTPAILITGAHHARELISIQMVVFSMLKLIQEGYVHKQEEQLKMLKQNRYYFIPVINVDGVELIQRNHLAGNYSMQNPNKGITEKRKNMGNEPEFKDANCFSTNQGVDLNRNYGVDWYLNVENNREANYRCSEFYAGNMAFSEKETQAMRAFLWSIKPELRFVINFHSNGGAFIWPFNGRASNDIEKRAPFVLPVIKQIVQNAGFPNGFKFGNSADVMGKRIGGDSDDYITGTFGIPAVTAEIGWPDQFDSEWTAKSNQEAYSIVEKNIHWLEFIYLNLPNYSMYLNPS